MGLRAKGSCVFGFLGVGAGVNHKPYVSKKGTARPSLRLRGPLPRRRGSPRKQKYRETGFIGGGGGGTKGIISRYTYLEVQGSRVYIQGHIYIYVCMYKYIMKVVEHALAHQTLLFCRFLLQALTNTMEFIRTLKTKNPRDSGLRGLGFWVYLESSRVVISGVISIVTLLIALLIATHEPPSRGIKSSGLQVAGLSVRVPGKGG